MKTRIFFFACFLGSASLQLYAADATLMQQLFVVKQAFPNIKTIGVLCHMENAAAVLKEMQIACSAYQVNLKIHNTATLQDVREGFDRMVKTDKIDLVWVLPDEVTDQKFGRRFLSERCIARKIPLCVRSVDNVREVALLAVAPDETGALRIYVNQKVSRQMSLTLPEEVQSRVIPVE